MIDIVCGGQFGDEGKGQIAVWLTHTRRNAGRPFFFAVRVGSSAAEHRFETKDEQRYTGRVLPVAGWVDPDVKLVLGAGHVIKLESLKSEVESLTRRFGPGQERRIYIDRNAGVIRPEHVQASEKTKWRGSTHQGGGASMAHKVLRDGEYKTAAAYKELGEFNILDTAELMADWLKQSFHGLLEGSQGALLSLNHGYYPFCTAKDVTPAALLAEAGIAMHWVRHIWTVFRTVPMRVPGNSGPYAGAELTWERLEDHTEKKLPEGVKRQTDSGERERIFCWSWYEYKRAIHLTGPTHLALTFADWYAPSLNGGVTLEDHIKTMEEIAGCPVYIVRRGAAYGDFSIGKYLAEKIIREKLI